ncbi:hypothetical protein FOA52_010874 [Chlamydomonas sp. UWO 241]|nr:hypothetical protein FOA52_010874 [Chlamydomonas sp. UWO 241]
MAAEQKNKRGGPAAQHIDALPVTESGLDAFKSQQQLKVVLGNLLGQLADPSVLLTPSSEVSATARQSAKALYRYCMRQILRGCSKGEAKALQSGSEPLLPELYTEEGFDAEQVWLQLELATGAALKRVRKLVLRATGPGGEGPATLVKPEYEKHIDGLIAEAEGGRHASDSDSEDDNGNGEGEEGEDSEEEEEEEAPAARRAAAGGSAKAGKRSTGKAPRSSSGGDDAGQARAGEDRFMKLDEMERFLEDAEARAADGGGGGFDLEGDEDEDEDGDGSDGGGGGGDDDDEDADLMDLGGGGFGSGDGSDDEDLEDLLRNTAALAGWKGDKGGKAAKGGKSTATRGLMYSDFFGGGEGNEGGEGGDDDDDEMEGRGAAGGGEDDEDDDGDVAGGDDDDDDMGGGGGCHFDQADDSEDDDGGGADDAGEDGEEGGGGAARASKGKGKSAGELDGLSTHERRLARLNERVFELETAATAEKAWQLRGEADARGRPLNSALEVDMDFDTTVRGAPAVTEEATADVEAMIKKRIADGRWDDVIRVVPPPLEKVSRAIDLDDGKSKKGLGELYEDVFTKAAVGGSATDKDDKIRSEAKALFQALVSKLDALSHFHYAPKPVVEELAIRSDVAAVLMEEAAPVVVSVASMRTAGEAFKPEHKGAEPRAEAELSREDRTRRRASGKRARRSETERKEGEARATAVAAGGVAPVSGRKSDDAAVLAKAGKRARLLAPTDGGGGGRSEFGKSAAVFAKIQESVDQAKAGIKVKGPEKAAKGKSGAALRL